MTKVFNTIFEVSLRVILLLYVVYDKEYISVDKITAYDFIALNGELFEISDFSLNGRGGLSYAEFAVRREQVNKAIKELVYQRLIEVNSMGNGFVYKISNNGYGMCNEFKDEYSKKYKFLIGNVYKKYKSCNEVQLMKLIDATIKKKIRG